MRRVEDSSFSDLPSLLAVLEDAHVHLAAVELRSMAYLPCTHPPVGQVINMSAMGVGAETSAGAGQGMMQGVGPMQLQSERQTDGQKSGQTDRAYKRRRLAETDSGTPGRETETETGSGAFVGVGAAGTVGVGSISGSNSSSSSGSGSGSTLFNRIHEGIGEYPSGSWIRFHTYVIIYSSLSFYTLSRVAID
jgi:hypothetical protein